MAPQRTTFNLRLLVHPRFWLAGPVTLIVSVVVMAAMSLWLPPGKADVDHLVFPVVLFPLIWACLFFYAVLDDRIKRAWLVFLILFIVNSTAVVASIMGLLT